MTDIIWHPGAPNSEGIYWFTNGVRKKFLIAQIKESTAMVFGNESSIPLSMIYDHRFCKEAVYAEVPAPMIWDKSLPSLKDYTEIWVKSSEGYIGLGLLRKDMNYYSGTIVWKNKPNCAFISGNGIISSEDKYMFSPVIKVQQK